MPQPLFSDGLLLLLVHLHLLLALHLQEGPQVLMRQPPLLPHRR